jgi:hypothetical protein
VRCDPFASADANSPEIGAGVRPHYDRGAGHIAGLNIALVCRNIGALVPHVEVNFGVGSSVLGGCFISTVLQYVK